MKPQLADVLFRLSELTCLASNVYHEARGEPEVGQVAVAQVTINRVASGRYPDSICETVHQRAQFSWTRGRVQEPSGKAWWQSVHVATRALYGGEPNPVGNATHFHAPSVSPRWAQAFHKIRTIGNHTFYEEKK